MSIPTISETKAIAERKGLRRCVILFQLADGRVGYASYGKTKELCNSTRVIMDNTFNALEAEFQSG